MTLLRLLESWGEGLLRIAIGIGLAWIGVVEGAGYGMFLEIVGAIFMAAGIGEIWFVEVAAHASRRRPSTSDIRPAPVTCDVPVFYATSEGQTRRIAERLVATFHDLGCSSRAIDVASADADQVDWGHVRAAIVGASLHAHRHQRSADAFVRRHGGDLNGHPSAFFSVSLAAASASPQERASAAQLARAFPSAGGWHPDETMCVAGRLAYTQYGVLTRFIMKRIARRHGAPTDTSRDHEFTNWEEVTRLADRIAHRVRADRTPRAA